MYEPSSNRLMVPLMKVIDINDLSFADRQCLKQIENGFKKARSSQETCQLLLSKALSDIKPSDPVNVLRHRLSPAFKELNPGKVYAQNRADFECGICSRIPRNVHRLRSLDAASFSGYIDFIAHNLGGKSWRTGNIYSAPDKQNFYVQFPDVSNVEMQIPLLAASGAKNFNGYPAFSAIMVLLGIFNCHPLVDGNGRTGRIFFNHIMQMALSSDFYLPLYELSAASCGGWLVAIRRAQNHSDWSGILQFIKNGILMFCETPCLGV